MTRVAFVQFACDFLAVVAAYATTLYVRFYSEWGHRLFTFINRGFGIRETAELGPSFRLFYEASAFRIVCFLTITLGILYALHNLYAGRRFLRARLMAWNVVRANVIALLLFFTYFYLRRNIFHPRSFFGTLIAFNTVYCILFRWLADGVWRQIRERSGRGRVPCALVGTSSAAEFLQNLLEYAQPHGIYVSARVPTGQGVSLDALCRDLADRVREGGLQLIVVADNGLSVNDIMRLVEQAFELGVPIKVLSDRLQIFVTHAQLPVDLIHSLPLVHFGMPTESPLYDVVRRAVARVAAAILFLLLLPLFGVIALLVRLSDPGPVLFIQDRIGINRKPFRMFKFRTMKDRASEQQAELEEFNDVPEGLLFKMRRDPRVTPIGRILRRFSLDELPQLWNILRGEMTFVGPRPLPRRDFENYYEDWHYSRHRGLPGLTCLWQVSGRSDLDFHDMCLLDIYYLHNRSWVLDAKIVRRTLITVLFGRGAY